MIEIEPVEPEIEDAPTPVEPEPAEDPTVEEPTVEEPEVDPGPSPSPPPEPEEPPPSEDAPPPAPDEPASPPASEPPGGVPQLDPTAQPKSGTALALGNYRKQSEGTGDGPGGLSTPAPRVSVEGSEHRREYGPERRFESAGGGAPLDDRPARSFAEAGFKLRASGNMVYRDPDWRFSAELQPDGRLVFRDLPGKFKGMPGLAEAAIQASGQELYRKQKRALLDKTFELRMGLAVSSARKAMNRRLAALYRDLLELWQRDSVPAPKRRRTIFSRWDECEEAPASVDIEAEFADRAGSELDQARTEAGREARAQIEQFIRRHLPKGSPDAFSEEELRELNRIRRSEQRFDPYDARE